MIGPMLVERATTLSTSKTTRKATCAVARASFFAGRRATTHL
jgi:hypothetical protein